MEVKESKVISASVLADQAFRELGKFQKGKRLLVKTGRHYIDSHIGGLKPSDLVLVGAKSGVGKTYELMKILKGVLNKELNPFANNFVSLEFMLEMKFLDLILRDTHSITKKKKVDILTAEFTPEEQALVREYYETLKDGRRFIVQETVNTEEFFDICDEFCQTHKDKDAIVISIDHLALILAKGAENPLDTVSTLTNILRKKYDNVYFIYLSQLNRSGEVVEKSNMMIPQTSHIYGSSHFEFLSSYVIVMANPFKQGVEEYMKFKQDRYPELKEFMTRPNDKGFCSFNTLGNIFTHVLKIRESDEPLNNLHIESLNLSEEQLDKMKMDIEKDDGIGVIEGMDDFESLMAREDKEYFDLSDHREDAPF